MTPPRDGGPAMPDRIYATDNRLWSDNRLAVEQVVYIRADLVEAERAERQAAIASLEADIKAGRAAIERMMAEQERMMDGIADALREGE